MLKCFMDKAVLVLGGGGEGTAEEGGGPDHSKTAYDGRGCTHNGH